MVRLAEDRAQYGEGRRVVKDRAESDGGGLHGGEVCSNVVSGMPVKRQRRSAMEDCCGEAGPMSMGKYSDDEDERATRRNSQWRDMILVMNSRSTEDLDVVDQIRKKDDF